MGHDLVNSFQDLAWSNPAAWLPPVLFFVSGLFAFCLTNNGWTQTVLLALFLFWTAQYLLEWLFILFLVPSFVPYFWPTPIFGAPILHIFRYRNNFALGAAADLRRFGERVYLSWMFHTPAYSIHDARCIRQILISEWRSFDRSWHESSMLERFLGGGLILARNSKWTHTRGLISKAFRRTKEFVPVIEQRTLELCDRLSEHVGQVVDLQQEIFLLTFDVILTKCFGRVDAAETLRFSNAFHTLLDSTIARMFNPFIRLPADWLLGFLPIFREGVKARQVLADFVAQHAKRARLDPEKDYEGTIVSDMIVEGRTNPFFGTDERITEELLTVLFAGHDTTAASISFALYYLARHPEWQERCRQEAASGESDTVVMACLKEALRLQPPAPLRGRCTTCAVELEDDSGRKIPMLSGSLCHFSIYNVHRDQRYWGLDAEEFNPARFLNSVTDNDVFLAFGAGPRRCPGEHVALCEGALVLSMLLKRFRFSWEEKAEIDVRMRLTLFAVHLRMRIESA